MEDYDETSNWFDEAIPTMPMTEGSGPEGTAELMSLGTPLLAAMSLTPVGRGIAGAVATVASIPEESEAGIFKLLTRSKFPKTGSGFKLVDEGAAVFPDMTRNIEFPTNSMAGKLEEGKRLKMSSISDAIEMPDTSRLSGIDKRKVERTMENLKSIPVFSRTEAGMVKTQNINENTNAFYSFPSESRPLGRIVVKRSDGEGNVITYDDMAGSAVHEFTHSTDVHDNLMKNIMRDRDVEYNLDLSESRAFLSGYRSKFDETLTNPNSEDFVHPMLSYGGGEVSMVPFQDFKGSLKHSYEKVGESVDDMFLAEYFYALKKEKSRIQAKVDTEPNFKTKLDVATIDTTDTNANWTLHAGQKKKLKTQQVERELAGIQKARALRAKQYEAKQLIADGSLSKDAENALIADLFFD